MAKGDILDMAREDLLLITSDGGFQSDVTVMTSDKTTSVVIPAIAMKHHLSFDAEGQNVNSEQAHISLSESLLVSKGFPVRNSNNDVSMIGVIIKYTDSSGVEGSYVVNENYPDEAIGLITLILSRYE